MTLVTNVYVSGSLAQAVYLQNGHSMIIDANDLGSPRPSSANDISFFFHSALEVRSVQDNGRPIELEEVAQRLSEEVARFQALDSILVGMDGDCDKAMRQRAISRAERLIVSSGEVAKFVQGRFLVPTNTQEWDLKGARSLAKSLSAENASFLYDALSSETFDRLVDAASVAIHAILGTGAQAARTMEVVVRSGLLGEITVAKLRNQPDRIATLIFRLHDFPELKSIDKSRQIVARLTSKRDHKRLVAEDASEEIEWEESASAGGGDPILAAIERFIDSEEEQKRRKSRRRTTAESLEGISQQISWVEARLQEGDIPASETALVGLIDYQSRRSRREHLVKSLTSIADIARKARIFDFSDRIFDACAVLGGQDAAARNARAELLRELGRHEEALAALDETIREFPRDEVAPTARAELLRDLGRHEEALAALDETIREFPRDEVARNARAELLRELGRHEEALAALDETIREFPRDEVAPTARAGLLRDLGRHEEALAALDETIREFPRNEVARTARAELLRELGRHEEALAALDETIREFPRDEVARTARAELLRDLGRHEEALVALDETIREFPRDEVARNARANLLSLMGNHQEVVESLSRISEAPRTQSDWVALHILAVSKLRAGHVEDSIKMLKTGRLKCPFRSSWCYFDGALATALLAERNTVEAAHVVDRAEKVATNAEQRKTVYLLRTHAAVDGGNVEVASNLLKISAELIPFETFLQRRLAQKLDHRIRLYAGSSSVVAEDDRRENDRDVFRLETLLVTKFASQSSTRFSRLAA